MSKEYCFNCKDLVAEDGIAVQECIPKGDVLFCVYCDALTKKGKCPECKKPIHKVGISYTDDGWFSVLFCTSCQYTFSVVRNTVQVTQV